MSNKWKLSFEPGRSWREIDHPRAEDGKFVDKDEVQMPDTPLVVRVNGRDVTFKYDPDQPRVPSGTTEGGQWTSEATAPGKVAYTTARASTWEEIEKTSNLFVHGEGEAWTDREREIADRALSDFSNLNSTRPVTGMVKVTGDNVDFVARSLGDGRIALGPSFFDDYYQGTLEKQFGGRKGVLAHEIGHELADIMTREEQDAYSRMWVQTRDAWKQGHARGDLGFAPDFSNYDEIVLRHWPSYQAMNGWHEDLAEAYRIHLRAGGEMGEMWQRSAILKTLVGRQGRTR